MFSDKLQEVRKKKGLTQQGLAELMGTTQANIARYEKGERKPKLETIRKYAEKLDVNFNELISFEDGMSLWIAEKKDFPMSNKEQRLIEAYRTAPEHIQEAVLKLLDLDIQSKKKSSVS